MVIAFFVYIGAFRIWERSSSSMVVSGEVSTCDSAHSWRLYSASPLEGQADGSMTRFSTESHYADICLTSIWPIIIMPCARLGNEKYQFFVMHWFDLTGIQTRNLLQWKLCSINSATVSCHIIDYFHHQFACFGCNINNYIGETLCEYVCYFS